MSVTDVPGFSAAGIASGIKSSGEADLAIVATSDGQPVAAAGVFTSNKMTAPPVLVSRAHLESTGGMAAGVILSSGNANAATGEQGMANATRMCELAAEQLGVSTADFLVCSTGLIGYQLPMGPIENGVAPLAAALSSDGGEDAARAMMTTDSQAKHVSVVYDSDGLTVRVGGIAKGAAMLEPNMATMLAVLTTDAELTPQEASEILNQAVGPAFNSLTVDGAQSTNDTVLLFANGSAGRMDPSEVLKPVADVCRQLAVMMADDAEGSTKTVFITVSGAGSDDEAAKVARSIANCQLVKCSWYGKDPYWGRVAAEAGSAADHFDPNTLTISYGDQVTYTNGIEQPKNLNKLSAIMDARHLYLTVDLGQGDGYGQVITTDLTHAYIDENMGTS
jgi:glutamate N-acetyltransferase/amino-acid N-acetyltransferase